MTTKTPPFSLRLTFEERARLEELAGDMPLGAYIWTYPGLVESTSLLRVIISYLIGL